MSYFRFLCAILLVLCVGFPDHVSARSCDGTVVDQVWTGVRVRFGAAVTDKYAFIVYYDAKRELTVARIDLDTCRVERKHLPSIFTGWDPHNYIAIALDNAGRIHLAGNMHSDPLVYFRSVKPLDIASLTPAPMIGANEKRVTYPRFLRSRGRLVFMYRDGRASDGQWFMNEWSGNSWRRVTEQPVFGSDQSGVVASAYPSRFALGPDGFFHVSVVWLGDPGFQNNYKLSYAKTPDFRHWFNHRGKALPTPLEPDTMDTVDDVGRNRGLMNNAKVAIDKKEGRPYITYTKYSERGLNGAYIATPADDGWRSELLIESKRVTVIDPRQTKGKLPTVSAVRFNKNGAVVQVRFPGEKVQLVQLHGLGAAVAPLPDQHRRWGPNSLLTEARRHLQAPQVMVSSPVDKKGEPSASVRFVSVAQAEKRGRPRKCMAKALSVCKPPPSPLILEVQ